MAEQNLGGFSVNLDEQTISMIRDTVESSKEIAEHMRLAGTANEVMFEYLRDINTTQREIVQQLFTYATISNQMVDSASRLEDLTKQNLETRKAITQETKQQTTELKSHAQLAKKQAARVEGKARRIARDPIRGLAGMLTNLIPAGLPRAAAIAGTGVAKKLGDYVSEVRAITRTGGVGMMEGVGLGGAAELQKEMAWATAGIPFLKERYATRGELTTGAGTLFGLGGFRGEELTRVFKDLPQQAHEMGMKFTDLTKLLAITNRVLDETPEALRVSFEEIADSAREAGHKVSDWVTLVTEITTKSAAYGSNLSKVNEIVKENYDLITSEKMSREELKNAIVEGYRARMTETEILERLRISAEGAAMAMGKVSDVETIRAQIESKIKSIMEDSAESQIFATNAAASLAEGVIQGTEELTTFLAVVKDLHGTWGLSAAEISGFTKAVDATAKKLDYSGAQLAKDAIDIGKTLMGITGDQKRSFGVGTQLAVTFAEELRDLNIYIADLQAMVSSLSDRFNLTGGDITALSRFFADLGDAVKTPTRNIITWQNTIAEGLVEMFDDPREAAFHATAAVGSFAKMLADGQVTTQDYIKVVKMQKDVMGNTDTGAIGQFSALTKIVENTNIRMSELAQWTSELIKLNRQYGYEQKTSNTLLAAFKDHLRSGALSIQDLQAAIRGPGGASEAARAMLVDRLRMERGPLGAAFQRAGVLGGIDVLLPDLMEYLNPDYKGEPTAALQEAFGEGLPTSPEAKRAMRQRIGGTFRDVTVGVTGTGVGAEAQAVAARLSGAWWGQDVSGAWGVGREQLLGVLQRGEMPEVTMRRDLERSTKSLTAEYGKFGGTTDEFGKKVDNFGSYISRFGRATNIFARYVAEQAAMPYTEYKAGFRGGETLIGPPRPPEKKRGSIAKPPTSAPAGPPLQGEFMNIVWPGTQ